MGREESVMIKAVRDTVIVRVIYAEKTGLIEIPDQAKQYSGNFCGRVISVGPDYKYDLKAGDKVYFRRHEGHKVIIDDITYLSLRSKWCIAKEVAE